MKRNKQLERYADKELSKFKDDNFKRQLLGVRYEKEPEKKKSKRLNLIISLSGLSTVIAVTVILLCVFLVKTPASLPEAERKYYAEENQISVDVSIDELNDKTGDFELIDKEGYTIKKTTDTYYNEDLYYRVNYYDEEILGSIQLDFVINADYDYTFSHNDYDKSDEIYNEQINYEERYYEEDDLFFFNSTGEIVTDSVKIYIIAETVSIDENSRFIEFINRIIKKK